ncbi:Geraniol 8-hydroxylase [Capsicum baccatum]|uniref:Geraniol 8-hydroxylase n=1 Tax=Capsicum baccatum TaxID=33114 RepID=A0A2G2V5L1_CAPBA|nr:Geraniol 8-hydroxylase [Capsicum baccatum]
MPFKHNYCKFSIPWLPVCPQWRTLRRILNTNLISSNKLDVNQHLRSQKVKELIAYCTKCSQEVEALDVGQVTFKTNLNLLSNTLFSKDLADPFSDSKVELKDVIWGIMNELGKPNLVDFYPILEKIDLQGIRRRTPLILDLFGAATDTTTSTVEWAMAEILKQPEIMKKAQIELVEIIGEGISVEEADVSLLPYLQCIIKETLRMHPPVPLLVPRKVEQDVELCSYIIPKGSQVLINLWAIGRDVNFWEDPLMFKPERFWSSNLDIKGQDFELIPFGVVAPCNKHASHAPSYGASMRYGMRRMLHCDGK